jgi:hypothetical protein
VRVVKTSEQRPIAVTEDGKKVETQPVAKRRNRNDTRGRNYASGRALEPEARADRGPVQVPGMIGQISLTQRLKETTLLTDVTVISILPQCVHTTTLHARSFPHMREGGLQVPPEALLSQEHHTTQRLVAEFEDVARAPLRTPLPQAFATNEHILGEAEALPIELVSQGGAAGVEGKEDLFEGGRVEGTLECFKAFDMTPGSTAFAVAPLARKGRRRLTVGSCLAAPFAARSSGRLLRRRPFLGVG